VEFANRYFPKSWDAVCAFARRAIDLFRETSRCQENAVYRYPAHFGQAVLKRISPISLMARWVDASKRACALFGLFTVAAEESAVTAVSGATAVSLSA